MSQNVIAAQKAIQAAKGFIHFRGSSLDTVTSMVIPMGFAAAGLTLLVKGMDDLRWGKNRKDGF